MKDFVRLVALEGEKENRTDARVSVESHLIALAAEKSRKLGTTIDFKEYKKQQK